MPYCVEHRSINIEILTESVRTENSYLGSALEALAGRQLDVLLDCTSWQEDAVMGKSSLHSDSQGWTEKRTELSKGGCGAIISPTTVLIAHGSPTPARNILTTALPAKP